MHLSRREIRQALEGAIADVRKLSVALDHLDVCEFCSEIADEERIIAEELLRASAEEITEEARELGKSLYQQSLRGYVVELLPLNSEKDDPDVRIAADSSQPKTPRIEGLLTLYSESPEFVLNVMRDNSAQRDYLQLNSDEQTNVSQVLVRIPQLDKELMTDTHGHVDLPEQLKTSASELSWQVKLPSAVFDLEPIIYDPEKIEFTQEVELETDSRDKIRVTFQRKTEGAQVIVRILELDGQKDFRRVKVVLTQEDSFSEIESESGNPVTFDINSKNSAINIRLFR